MQFNQKKLPWNARSLSCARFPILADFRGTMSDWLIGDIFNGVNFIMAKGHETVCHGQGGIQPKAALPRLEAFKVWERYGLQGAKSELISNRPLGVHTSCWPV